MLEAELLLPSYSEEVFIKKTRFALQMKDEIPPIVLGIFLLSNLKAIYKKILLEIRLYFYNEYITSSSCSISQESRNKSLMRIIKE